MKTIWRSLAMAGVLAVGGLGSSEARAQFYGGYARPGLSINVGGAYPAYGAYGYPALAPPVVVAAPPVVVAPSVVVGRPFYGGGYYGGGYRPYSGYGYRPYGGGYGYGYPHYRR